MQPSAVTSLQNHEQRRGSYRQATVYREEPGLGAGGRHRAGVSLVLGGFGLRGGASDETVFLPVGIRRYPEYPVPRADSSS